MADLPEQTGALSSELPYLALYLARDLINWDAGQRERLSSEDLNLVVLDETGPVREGFEWTAERRHRVLVLVLGEAAINEPSGQARYRTGVFAGKAAAFSADGLIEPSWRGHRLDFIPFSFINASDIAADPDDPPLMGLARLALTIYRLEADYRQALFLQGQDCPSSNRWDRCLVLLRECFAHHFHVRQRVVDSANDVSRWSFV